MFLGALRRVARHKWGVRGVRWFAVGATLLAFVWLGLPRFDRHVGIGVTVKYINAGSIDCL